MSNPYFWDFPQRNDTMYMSTIENKSGAWQRDSRQSTFQKKDIDGAFPKQLIPPVVTRDNFSLSSQIEPRPENYRNIKKVSNPLRIDDIEFAQPQCVEFKTNRVNNPTNPLVPRYKLPSFSSPAIQPPAKFLRNTLDVSDLQQKRSQHKYISSPKNQTVEGSQPTRFYRANDGISRLSVKDINNDGKFVSRRTQEPIDPLNPSYIWRDTVADAKGFSFTNPTLLQEPKQLNKRYGDIEGGKPKKLFHESAHRSMDRSKQIEGAQANSSNQRRLFLSKRKQFRDYMKTNDIDKTFASSLKKGISTSRNVNPLMPNYRYPE